MGTNAGRFGWVCAIALLLGAIGLPAAPGGAGSRRLLNGYFRYLLSREVPAQGAALTKGLDDAAAESVRAALSGWSEARLGIVRKDLEAEFGDQARERFERFVTDYAAAETKADAAFLAALVKEAGIRLAPADYGELRRGVLDGDLAEDMRSGSTLLAEIQTWVKVRSERRDAPALDIWLTRAQRGPGAPVAVATPPKRGPPPDPLREAEAAAPALPEGDAAAAGPLDTFAQQRKDRRARALQEAQAGMQQVAVERQAAEQEYAAKKMATAQAEAEALKNHAEKLASVEKDAAEQRKNSWGNRIKSIVGATVTAATGAFTGGLGTRAGEAAAAEIFK